MNTCLFVTLILTGAGGSQVAWPQATNRFATQATAYAVDRVLTLYSIPSAIPPEEVAALPAEQAPPQHWGNIVDGRQVSVWLEDTSFWVGQPIFAYVLLRNVDADPLSFNFLGTDPLIGLSICITNTAQLPVAYTAAWAEWLKSPNRESSGWSPQEIPRGSQRKFRIQLDAFYDLSVPGEYFVTVKRRANGPPGWAASAAVKFRIVNNGRQPKGTKEATPANTEPTPPPRR